MRKEMISPEIANSYGISGQTETERAGFEPAVQVYARTTV